MVRATNPSAQLVKLRQAEIIRAVNNNRVSRRYVNTGFYDSGTQQQIKALVIKVGHDLFQLTFTHLTVCYANNGFW